MTSSRTPRRKPTAAAKRATNAKRTAAKAAASAAADASAAGGELELKGGVLIALVATDDPQRDELRISPVGDTRLLEVGDLLAKALAIHRRNNEA